MNKQEFLNKRNELLTLAQSFLNEGKVKEANETMNEVTDLETQYDEFTKANANLEALNKSGVASNILAGVVTPTVLQTGTENIVATQIGNDEDMYRTATLNYLMGKELSNDQRNVFDKVNMSTDGNTILIPEQTAAKIWLKVNELFPFYAKTTKTSVKGTFTLVQENTSTDAEFYDEETETKAGNETPRSYHLTGCELSRAIDVSWKLKAMAMDDFENYIITKMARKMGAAAAHSGIIGRGKPGESDDFKEEPFGVITVLKAEDKTPQVVKVTAELTFKDITTLISKVKSAYKKEFYAKGTYIWNVLANIVDKQGRPYFIADTTNGAVGRMLGIMVYEDDSIPDDHLLVGDPSLYQFNFNKQITLDTEENKKKRITSYIGYAILDGAPIDNEAFAVLYKEVVAK